MPKFEDSKGRLWDLSIDAPKAQEVRRLVDPLFLKGAPIETLNRLENDPVTLCTVIQALCADQIEQRGITLEEFYLAVLGDVIERAELALTEAILLFIPGRQRELLERGAQTNAAVRAAVIEKTLARLNDPTLAPSLIEKMESDFHDRLTPFLSATSSPGSSGSTPAD